MQNWRGPFEQAKYASEALRLDKSAGDSRHIPPVSWLPWSQTCKGRGPDKRVPGACDNRGCRWEVLVVEWRRMKELRLRRHAIERMMSARQNHLPRFTIQPARIDLELVTRASVRTSLVIILSSPTSVAALTLVVVQGESQHRTPRGYYAARRTAEPFS